MHGLGRRTCVWFGTKPRRQHYSELIQYNLLNILRGQVVVHEAWPTKSAELLLFLNKSGRTLQRHCLNTLLSVPRCIRETL